MSLFKTGRQPRQEDCVYKDAHTRWFGKLELPFDHHVDASEGHCVLVKKEKFYVYFSAMRQETKHIFQSQPMEKSVKHKRIHSYASEFVQCAACSSQ